jgi:hypothetical protein
MNMTLIERGTTILSHAKLPNYFWAKALNHAMYILNQSPQFLLQVIFLREFGQVDMYHTSTWRSLVARLLCTYRGMGVPSLIARQSIASISVVQVMNLDKDCGIQSRRRPWEVEMWFSLNKKQCKLLRNRRSWRLSHPHRKLTWLHLTLL